MRRDSEKPARGGTHSVARVFAALPPEMADPPEATAERPAFGMPLAKRQQLTPSFGEGWVDFLDFGNGLEGYHANFRCARDVATPVEGADVLKFHFKLLGNNTVDFANGECTTVHSGEMAVLIHPAGLRKLDCMPRQARERSLTLACRPGVMTRMLGVDPDCLPAPLRDFEIGRQPAYFLKTMPLTGLAHRALEELAAAPFGGRFAQVHASLRTVDLVCAFLDALIGDEQHGTPRLSGRDERLLEGIRSYLAGCYTSPPTIVELARMAGMNRTKLTQAFRNVYRETITEYCQRLRMTEARRRLLEGESAGRVAAAVGYEHQSSFSQAYKAYFGFAPIASRRANP